MRLCQRDASLIARVVKKTPLFYSDGADSSLDRPRHVRAGSSLLMVKDSSHTHTLAIVQVEF